MCPHHSPAAELQKGTVNALRYGQLYAGGGGRSAKAATLGKGSGGGGASASGGGSKPWQRRGSKSKPTAPCDPAVLAELRAIYAEHVPEKSAAEVEVILRKFAGREATLLGKVRAKYVDVDDGEEVSQAQDSSAGTLT